MTITKSTLDDIFKVFETRFNAAQQAAVQPAFPNELTEGDIAITVQSGGAATVHAWLNQIKGMRQWVGPRVINALKAGVLTVTNDDYENTVGVSRNNIEDDSYGVFAPLIGAMGADSQLLWRRLAVAALQGNGLWADGNPFFCSGRQLGDAGSVITNAVAAALSKAAVESAIATMRAWKGAGGEPLEVAPDTLVVGPALESLAKLICEADLVANDAGTATQSNVSTARALKVRVSGRILGNGWFVTGRKGGIPAVAVQQRKAGILTRMDADSDEAVFMLNEYRYGTHARGASFLTMPFLAYAGGMSGVPAWAEKTDGSDTSNVEASDLGQHAEP